MWWATACLKASDSQRKNCLFAPLQYLLTHKGLQCMCGPETSLAIGCGKAFLYFKHGRSLRKV